MALERERVAQGSRNLVDREDYEREKRGNRYYRLRQRLVWRVCLLSIFVLLFRFGTFPLPEGGRILLWEAYGETFLREAQISLLLVFPALIATVLLTMGFSGLEYLVKKSLAQLPRIGRPLSRAVYSLLGAVPSLLSSVPLFIIAIYLIQLLHIDTVNTTSYFHPYGVLALAIFNFNDFYRRSRHRIRLAYRSPQILYARSLGIDERAILSGYILPLALKDHLVMIRELIPHLLAEAIVVEYAFSFGALGRSVLMAIQYRDWYYFAIVMFAFFLFIEFCDEIFCALESLLLPNQ